MPVKKAPISTRVELRFNKTDWNVAVKCISDYRKHFEQKRDMGEIDNVTYSRIQKAEWAVRSGQHSSVSKLEAETLVQALKWSRQHDLAADLIFYLANPQNNTRLI